MKETTERVYSEIKKYEANDGKIFYSKRDCIRHDIDLKLDKIKKIDADLQPFIDQSFYFVDSQETLDFLVTYIFMNEHIDICNKEIKVGDWVSMRYEYNENGADSYHLITMETILLQTKKMQTIIFETRDWPPIPTTASRVDYTK